MTYDEVIKDIETARDILLKTDSSIVVVKDGVVLAEKHGEGMKPFLETIDELRRDIIGSTIGARTLGKSSALLCAYSKVRGVYSPQGTKTAIAVLIRSGVTSQVDKLVPYVVNRTKDNICPFEQMLKDVDDPLEAYNILKNMIQV